MTSNKPLTDEEILEKLKDKELLNIIRKIGDNSNKFSLDEIRRAISLARKSTAERIFKDLEKENLESDDYLRLFGKQFEDLKNRYGVGE